MRTKKLTKKKIQSNPTKGLIMSHHTLLSIIYFYMFDVEFCKRLDKNGRRKGILTNVKSFPHWKAEFVCRVACIVFIQICDLF